jgi:hypothetical protein
MTQTEALSASDARRLIEIKFATASRREHWQLRRFWNLREIGPMGLSGSNVRL